MGKFFTFQYYFDTTPGPQFKYWLAILIFAAFLFIASLLIKAYRQKTNDKILKKMLKDYPSKLTWFALVAAFLVFVRIENVTLLSMRFFWIAYFALFFYVVVKNIKVFYKEYPRKLKQSLTHQGENKYVPTLKKRKKK